jgi:hypothetical protein
VSIPSDNVIGLLLVCGPTGQVCNLPPASSAALVGEASQAIFDLKLQLPTQVII